MATRALYHTAVGISSASRFRPLARLGAQVTGADALHLPAATILAALHRHKVLHLRPGAISQAELVEWFASLGVTPLSQLGREHARGSERDEVFVVSDRGEPSPFLSAARLELHSDLSYRREPGTFSALYAVAVPEVGGDTVFVDCVAALSSLEPPLQERLRTLHARHAHPEAHMNPSSEREDGRDGVRHPVVRRHPVTGEEALFLSPYFVAGLEGDLSAEEGARLLRTANAALELPELHYVHRWSVGDLVIWDNRCTVHGRQKFEGKRVLWRTQARGPF